jgi:hypothetical protein
MSSSPPEASWHSSPAKNPKTARATSWAPVTCRSRPTKSSPTWAAPLPQQAPDPAHVAKITIFAVRHQPAYLPVIEEARVALFGDHKPADTLVGVQALARPGYLIEVDAIAIIDS